MIDPQSCLELGDWVETKYDHETGEICCNCDFFRFLSPSSFSLLFAYDFNNLDACSSLVTPSPSCTIIPVEASTQRVVLHDRSARPRLTQSSLPQTPFEPCLKKFSVSRYEGPTKIVLIMHWYNKNRTYHKFSSQLIVVHFHIQTSPADKFSNILHIYLM